MLSRTAEIDNLFYAGQCMLGSFILFPGKPGYTKTLIHAKHNYLMCARLHVSTFLNSHHDHLKGRNM